MGDFLGAAEAAEGNAAEDRLVEARVVRLALFPRSAGKLDRAGGDAVDADALFRLRRGLAHRVLDHRGLDRAVGRRARRGGEAGDRRDVDDRATTGRLHMRERRPARSHRRHQIDRNAGLPPGLGIGRAEARGVVDEDVDPAQRLGRAGDIGGDLPGIGEVAHRGMRLDPGRSDRQAGVFERLGAARADRHRRAGSGETERDRPPDSPAAAANHRPFTRKIDLHDAPLTPLSMVRCCADRAADASPDHPFG